MFTQRVREQFQPLVERAMRQFLNDQANDRLQNAIAADVENDPVGGGVDAEPVPEPPVDRDRVVTTEDELEGYRVVRAIVCSEVSASRVVARDNKSYFSILLDGNNRRPIARLWFNRTQKYLGVFDENKTETRIPITEAGDIYQYADQLRRTVARYAGGAPGVETVVAVLDEASVVGLVSDDVTAS